MPSTDSGTHVTVTMPSTPSIPSMVSTVCSGMDWLLTTPALTTASAVISSVAPKTENLIDAPRMPTAHTNATPRVSAKAVAAMRRGLRERLVRASSGTTAPDRERDVNTWRATPASSSRTPRMSSTVPIPRYTVRVDVDQSPTTAAASDVVKPATRSRPPMRLRTRTGCVEDWSPERIAWTGWTRPARRAPTR